MKTIYETILALLTFAASAATTHALTVPKLSDLATALQGTKLSYRAAIGRSGPSSSESVSQQPFQMKDMKVELSRNRPYAKKQGSTGVYDALLEEMPYYVDGTGRQRVDLGSGRWEINWDERGGSPHGFLACGFVSPRAFRRTEDGTALEEGRFVMLHRVWTEQTLASERKRRREIQNEAARHLRDRDVKVAKMQQEGGGGAWSRMKSYGQAVSAMNRYHDSGYKEALFIPLYDEQVLELAQDCIVSTRGLVYKIEKSSNLIAETNEMIQIGESRVDWPKECKKEPFIAKYKW